MCSSASQAYAYLNSGTVDLLLLDIEMPGLSGIEFVKSLTFQPAIIFTTAYPEYAVQGFELDVIDYLVKPISFQRFVKAVHKAKDFLTDNSNETLAGEKNYVCIKANGGCIRFYTAIFSMWKPCKTTSPFILPAGNW